MGLLFRPTIANAFLCLYKKLWFLELSISRQKLNLLYKEDMFTKYLFCLTPKIICYRSPYVYKLDIKVYIDFEQNNGFSFLDVKVTL